MHKAAVIGDYDSIYGFGALGIDVFPVEDKTEAVHQIRRLVKGSYAMIYIVESLAEKVGDELEKYKELITPAIILIPGVAGNTGAGVLGVKNSVEQAIGSDILFS